MCLHSFETWNRINALCASKGDQRRVRATQTCTAGTTFCYCRHDLEKK